VSALLLNDASKPAAPLTNGAINQTLRSSAEGHPEQHNQLDLSLGCLGATCQARSTLITQPVSGVAGLSALSDISRGSVATHLSCGGICSDSFITNCLLILTVKNFKNRLIFGEVMRRRINSAIFGTPCTCYRQTIISVMTECDD